jgi:hypothetical protein
VQVVWRDPDGVGFSQKEEPGGSRVASLPGIQVPTASPLELSQSSGHFQSYVAVGAQFQVSVSSSMKWAGRRTELIE